MIAEVVSGTIDALVYVLIYGGIGFGIYKFIQSRKKK